MQGSVPALWMDGQSAEVRPARLLIRDGTLVVQDATGQATFATWPLSRVRVDTLQEGGIAHIECDENAEAHATTDDAIFIGELLSRGSTVRGLPAGRHRLIVSALCAAAVVALLGGLYFAAPWLSVRVARSVPMDVEQRLAPQMGALFQGHMCETPGARRALDALERKLDPDGSIEADVRVVNLPFANAFALPGGMVVLTRGLIDEAGGADEIAGVLAHELAHVKHRHVLAQMIQNAFLGAVWAVTLGDYSGFLVVDPDTAYNIATLRHSRAAEAQADATAQLMLNDKGISSQGLVDFFRRHRSSGENSTAFLSSHPTSDDRIRRLTSAPKSSKTSPALDQRDLDELRKACASTDEIGSLKELFF